jgi:alpha-tubulin suppressor-like RCC1 family protein
MTVKHSARAVVLGACLLSACAVDVSEVPGPRVQVEGPVTGRDSSVPGLDGGSDGSSPKPSDHRDAGPRGDAEACEKRVFYFDRDHDDYGTPDKTIEACERPEGYVENDGDCDDNCFTCKPGMTEVCNGVDDNCADGIDEKLTVQRYPDRDGDEYGDREAQLVAVCPGAEGFVEDHSDCDDTERDTHPGAPELCDLLDNNCVGGVDENVQNVNWYADADEDGFGDPASTPTEDCKPPGEKFAQNQEDCDDAEETINPSASDDCDGIDNDCDPATDDGRDETWFQTETCDAEGDSDTDRCMEDTFSCVSARKTCVARGANLVEVCDDADNDCDGATDDALSRSCDRGCGAGSEMCKSGEWINCSAPAKIRVYTDGDGDGFGDPTKPSERCAAGGGFVLDNSDCKDDCSTCKPGASEVCDNLDNDCDSSIDDNIAARACNKGCGGGTESCSFGSWVNCSAPAKTTQYTDGDGDGYGNPLLSSSQCPNTQGYVVNRTDCDDSCLSCNPGGSEEASPCDRKDNNCNMVIDEGGFTQSCMATCGSGTRSCQVGGAGWGACVGPTQQTFYRDKDDDGHGLLSVTRQLCQAGLDGGYSWVSTSDDCNDDCKTCYPGRSEVCDGNDNDCDMQKDEGFDLTSDNDNCGMCGTECSTSRMCFDSTCTLVTTVVEVEGGGLNGCARRLNGTIDCWGSNQYGNLGIGSAVATDCKVNPNDAAGQCSNLPRTVSGSYIDLSVGDDYACAVKSDGTVACWGRGDGSRQGQQSPAPGNNCVVSSATCQRGPTTLSSLSGITRVETGEFHTCAITGTKQVRCWGQGAAGQLGNPDAMENQASPVGVRVNASTALAGVSQLALGDYHTCAALEAGGVSCWGEDQNGQLGQGAIAIPACSTTVKCLKVATPVAALNGVGITKLVAGERFSCVLRASDSRVYCWGDNSKHQLGVGDTTARATPTAVNLPGGLKFIDVAAGQGHACALEQSGDVYCWGANNQDQCGSGFANPLTVPSKVPGATDVLAITAGRSHTCGRVTTGAICWGYNVYGQLGNGANQSNGQPQTVQLQ